MIRRFLLTVVAAFLFGMVTACYGGTGSVYVGVAAPGPWVGYPYPYPGVPGVIVGYPPHYWDDDQDHDADGQGQPERDGDAENEIDAERVSPTREHDRPR